MGSKWVGEPDYIVVDLVVDLGLLKSFEAEAQDQRQHVDHQSDKWTMWTTLVRLVDHMMWCEPLSVSC